MITILVADDHAVVRTGVRSLLRDDPDMRVAAEARSIAEVLQQVRSRHFDVVLLDVRLPDGSGVDLIPTLRKQSPETRIVMFTNAEEEASRALAAGATGFLSKDALADDLKGAIKAAVRGGSVVSPRVARQLQSSVSEPQRNAKSRDYDGLSGRELEILLKLVAGLRNKEIALQLGISEKTVHTHRARMLKKLGLSDMRSLMLYAMRNGLTDWAPQEINAT